MRHISGPPRLSVAAAGSRSGPPPRPRGLKRSRVGAAPCVSRGRCSCWLCCFAFDTRWASFSCASFCAASVMYPKFCGTPAGSVQAAIIDGLVVPSPRPQTIRSEGVRVMAGWHASGQSCDLRRSFQELSSRVKVASTLRVTLLHVRPRHSCPADRILKPLTGSAVAGAARGESGRCRRSSTALFEVPHRQSDAPQHGTGPHTFRRCRGCGGTGPRLLRIRYLDAAPDRSHRQHFDEMVRDARLPQRDQRGNDEARGRTLQ